MDLHVVQVLPLDMLDGFKGHSHLDLSSHFELSFVGEKSDVFGACNVEELLVVGIVFV